MQSSIGKMKTKQIAWHCRVKLIIEAATSGKMPDLIKKKIDHRLDCHHYHFTTVSLDVGQWSRRRRRRRRETNFEKKDGTYVRACVHICACVNDNQVSSNGSNGATCKHNTSHCHQEKEHRLIKNRQRNGCISSQWCSQGQFLDIDSIIEQTNLNHLYAKMFIEYWWFMSIEFLRCWY